MFYITKRQFLRKKLFYLCIKRYNDFMDDKKERKLTIIERSDVPETESEKTTATHHTNPIMKKLMNFHLEKASKLKVRDIFKK